MNDTDEEDRSEPYRDHNDDSDGMWIGPAMTLAALVLCASVLIYAWTHA